MLKYGQEYVDKGSAQYQAKYHEQQIRYLKKKLLSTASHLFPCRIPLKEQRLELNYHKRVSVELMIHAWPRL
jgi:hypothetical protein